MGCQGYIHPYRYYEPDCHEGGDGENQLKNVNNIKIDLICPRCHRPKPHRSDRNKLVNINNITICVDGHKVKHDCW